MPSQSTFWDKIAPRYAARPVDFPEAYAETLDRVRAYLSSTDTVLELGAGTGSTAIKLAHDVAAYLATDFSPRMTEIAKAKPEGQALTNLSFMLADPAGAPEGPYDAILAFSFLHLVDDLDGTLREIHKRLPKGGHFISKTPCLANLGAWLRVLVPAMRLVGQAPPVLFLSRTSLETAIQSAGFEIVETGDYPEKRAARFVVARKT